MEMIISSRLVFCNVKGYIKIDWGDSVSFYFAKLTFGPCEFLFISFYVYVVGRSALYFLPGEIFYGVRCDFVRFNFTKLLNLWFDNYSKPVRVKV
jgi:hypothetical protein